MSKIWYCVNCGYEVHSRGRCHSCRERFVASDLPELPADDDADEVGYRLEDWEDRDRGLLIEKLNELEVLHRFEDDELVVAADDESCVDDLVAEVTALGTADSAKRAGLAGGATAGGATPEGATAGGAADAEEADPTEAALRLLVDAARRLRADPTDMHADADIAEASTAVFMADEFYGVDEDTWAAVGRVTRRLLGALGAEEALEDEIRSQAGVLDKLVTPLIDDSEEKMTEDRPETVYELPEWTPEQRAELGILLDEAGIDHDWDVDELIVPAEREAEAEALFDRVGGTMGAEDDDGETRYRAIEELFAAADRLANAPDDEERAADAVERIKEAVGPPPVGMDEVYWFRIMTRAKALSEAIGAGRDRSVVADEAAALRDLLRTVV